MTSALVCLCGLPAAGKSTLARHILVVGAGRLLSALGAPGVRLWHICFDDVFAALQREQGAADFDPELWHRARERALLTVNAYFLKRAGTTALEAVASCASAGNTDDASCIDVLLIDDNMHYRSMRRAYYKVAREAQLAFCAICLPVAIEEAVARDARRQPPHHVGRVTIEVMAQALQWPEPERFPWEGVAIRLEEWSVGTQPPMSTASAAPSVDEAAATANGSDGRGEVTALPTPCPPPPSAPTAAAATPPAPAASAPWEASFWRELAEAIEEPVEAEATTGIEAAARAMLASASAAETAESVVHQFDLRLRKIVTAQMKSAEVLSLGGKERAAFAKLISERKKEALFSCKRQLALSEEGESDAAVDTIEQQFAIALRVTGER